MDNVFCDFDDLIGLAKDGDSGAFEEVVRTVAFDDNDIDTRRRDKVALYARKINYIDTDEDLIQDIKLKIWESIKSYNPERGSFVSFCWINIKRKLMDKKNKYFRDPLRSSAPMDSFQFEDTSNATLYREVYVKKILDDIDGDEWIMSNLLMAGWSRRKIKGVLGFNDRMYNKMIGHLRDSFSLAYCF